MSKMRISGFASGLDSDALVRDMMRAEKMKTDKQYRRIEMLKWQQSAYRGVISKIRDFKKANFNLLDPNNNFMSASVFSDFNYTVETAAGVASKAVSIRLRGDAKVNENKIDKITQLATNDNWIGKKANVRGIKSNDIDLDALKAEGKPIDIMLKISSTTKKISISADELNGLNNISELATLMDGKIVESFGQDYANTVTADGNKINLDMKGNEIRFYQKFPPVIVPEGEEAPPPPEFSVLGIKQGATSYAYKQKTIGEIFGFTDADLKDFEINGKKIALNADMKITDLSRALRDSEAGVKLNYDSLTDSFTLNASKVGTANDIRFEDGSVAEKILGKLLGSTNLIDANGNTTDITRNKAQNAVLTINGEEIIKGDNVFDFEGMIITLNSTSNESLTVKGTVDTDKVIEKVENFVKNFNTMLDEIYKETTAERNREFEPLTEAEKENMTEKQIEQWEKQAKSGIIRSSREIESFVTKLRNALVDPVEGSHISLRSIGVYSKSYVEKGKLTVDREKLKNALEKNMDQVVNLFTRTSDIKYTNEDKRSERYKQIGIGGRFDDIINDYTRTRRNKKGSKGILVAKAGVENDLSVTENQFSKEIKERSTRLRQMLKVLEGKEESYYQMFSRMETAMSKMQNQTNSLLAMLGTPSK